MLTMCGKHVFENKLDFVFQGNRFYSSIWGHCFVFFYFAFTNQCIMTTAKGIATEREKSGSESFTRWLAPLAPRSSVPYSRAVQSGVVLVPYKVVHTGTVQKVVPYKVALYKKWHHTKSGAIQKVVPYKRWCHTKVAPYKSGTIQGDTVQSGTIQKVVPTTCGEQGGKTGSEGARQGVRGSEGSKGHVILGFRVPTTCDGKKFNNIIECLGVPTTCKNNHHLMYIHRAAKGLGRSPPRAQNFGAKTANRPLRWL